MPLATPIEDPKPTSRRLRELLLADGKERNRGRDILLALSHVILLSAIATATGLSLTGKVVIVTIAILAGRGMLALRKRRSSRVAEISGNPFGH